MLLFVKCWRNSYAYYRYLYVLHLCLSSLELIWTLCLKSLWTLELVALFTFDNTEHIYLDMYCFTILLILNALEWSLKFPMYMKSSRRPSVTGSPWSIDSLFELVACFVLQHLVIILLYSHYSVSSLTTTNVLIKRTSIYMFVEFENEKCSFSYKQDSSIRYINRSRKLEILFTSLLNLYCLNYYLTPF